MTERRKRKPIPKAVRARVFAKSGFACERCGSTSRLGIDHILALANGGTDDEENLRVLCSGCNRSKGNSQDPKWLVRQDPIALEAALARVVAARKEQVDASAAYAEAIKAAVAGGMTYTELGQILGVSRQAVRQYVERERGKS